MQPAGFTHVQLRSQFDSTCMCRTMCYRFKLVALVNVVVCRSSQLSRGSSPWSCTTRSSTPTSILNPPTTEKKHRTPPFNVYDAQPQNFKNPLFGTKASPSPQLAAAAYTGKHIAASDRTDLGSLDCEADTTADPDSGYNSESTAVANLSQEIDAVAGYESALCSASPDQH